MTTCSDDDKAAGPPAADTRVSIVTWEAPSHIAYAALSSAASAAGLPGSLLRDMLPRNAFSRVKAAMQRDASLDIGEVGETPQELHFQFTRRMVAGDLADGTAHIDFRRQMSVRVDKDTGIVTGDDPVRVSQLTELVADEIGRRTRSDVTRMIKRYFRHQVPGAAGAVVGEGPTQLVPFSDSGYTYVVPHVAENLRKLDAVAAMLTAIGGKLKRLTLDTRADANAAEVLALMDDSVTRHVEALNEEVSGMLATADEDVLQRRLGNVTALSAHLQLLEGYLAHRASQLRTDLGGIHARITAALSGGLPASG